MSESVGTMFDQLAASTGIQLTQLPMSGRQILANAAVGEDFRADLFRFQADMLPPEGVIPDEAVTMLDAALERGFQRNAFDIDLGGYLAVTGIGLYLAVDNPGLQPADVKILMPDQYLFGTLLGVTFNSYPYVPGIETLPLDYEEEIMVDEREGLVMTLGSAMLYSLEDDYGRLEEQIEYAHIPLPEHTLSIHGAEILE